MKQGFSLHNCQNREPYHVACIVYRVYINLYCMVNCITMQIKCNNYKSTKNLVYLHRSIYISSGLIINRQTSLLKKIKYTNYSFKTLN